MGGSHYYFVYRDKMCLLLVLETFSSWPFASRGHSKATVFIHNQTLIESSKPSW